MYQVIPEHSRYWVVSYVVTDSDSSSKDFSSSVLIVSLIHHYTCNTPRNQLTSAYSWRWEIYCNIACHGTLILLMWFFALTGTSRVPWFCFVANTTVTLAPGELFRFGTRMYESSLLKFSVVSFSHFLPSNPVGTFVVHNEMWIMWWFFLKSFRIRCHIYMYVSTTKTVLEFSKHTWCTFADVFAGSWRLEAYSSILTVVFLAHGWARIVHGRYWCYFAVTAQMKNILCWDFDIKCRLYVCNDV